MLTAGWDLLRDGTLTEALWASLQRVLWGLGIGIPLGVVLALVAGLSRPGDDLVDANMQMLRFVPIIALQPLLIVWLGVGETAKITLIVLGVAFPIYVNTSAAIRSIDPGLPRAGVGGRAEPDATAASRSCCPARCPASSSACASPWPSPGCCSCSPSRSTPRAASAT